MTRRTLNADGTITLKSFSLQGNGDAAETFRQELAELEERNRQARAIWDSLTPEEREQRTRDFEARQQARQEAIRAAAEIPPHVLAKISESEPPEPGAVFNPERQPPACGWPWFQGIFGGEVRHRQDPVGLS